MNKSKITSILRIIAEIAALAVFVLLLKKQTLQMWVIIFGASALLSIFLGRFYCSWICPMNTSFRLIGLLYSKIGIKRFKTPGFLTNNVFRIVILFLFVASMVLSKKFGLKINMILYITLFAVVLTLFFEENLWHRRVCPFGTILSFTSRKSVYRLDIDEEACIACGKCQKVCPSDSISTVENKKRRNLKQECLLCGKCIEVCPASACRYKMR